MKTCQNWFTFQYGYIYYVLLEVVETIYILIYIPIWLYLLFGFQPSLISSNIYLHSNMVIFIIHFHISIFPSSSQFTFQYGYIYYYIQYSIVIYINAIYIPIWLYLLFLFLLIYSLHLFLFTFQYGYIYYALERDEGVTFYNNLHSNMVIFIIKRAY